MRILILGGTKDSTNIIEYIKKELPETYILTTTTTEYGSKLAKKSGSNETISKPLLKNELIKTIKEKEIDILIDATHPFATHITKTATEIHNENNIPFIRYERPTTDLKNIDTTNIHTVNDFVNTGKKIKELNLEKENILHFAGANTMEDVLKHVNVNYFYPRILKSEPSIKKCEKLNIPQDHVIFMNGVSNKEENIELIKKYNAKAIITKDSGDIGGIYEKISAANKLNIKTILVTRPNIDGLKKENIVNDLDNVIKKIK